MAVTDDDDGDDYDDEREIRIYGPRAVIQEAAEINTAGCIHTGEFCGFLR